MKWAMLSPGASKLRMPVQCLEQSNANGQEIPDMHTTRFMNFLRRFKLFLEPHALRDGTIDPRLPALPVNMPFHSYHYSAAI